MRRDHPPTRRERRRRSRRKRLFEWTAFLVVALALLVTWPRSLGGRVSYLMVSGHSMAPTMHDGDVAVLRAAGEYHVGQIVAYQVPEHDVGGGTTVVHRIVGGNARSGFIMRGDNNSYVDPWHPKAGDMLGVRWALLPRAGNVFTMLRAPLIVALLAGVVGAALAYSAKGRPRARSRPRPERVTA